MQDAFWNFLKDTATSNLLTLAVLGANVGVMLLNLWLSYHTQRMARATLDMANSTRALADDSRSTYLQTVAPRLRFTHISQEVLSSNSVFYFFTVWNVGVYPITIARCGANVPEERILESTNRPLIPGQFHRFQLRIPNTQDVQDAWILVVDSIGREHMIAVANVENAFEEPS